MLEEKNKTSYLGKLVFAQLTFKESEVFSLCKKGMSCQGIGDALFISVETVKTHRKNILKKRGLSGKQAFSKFLMDLLAEDPMLLHVNSPQNHP